MDNKFFKNALKKSAKIIKNKERLVALLASAKHKIKALNVETLKNHKLADRLKVILRMVKAYANGSYRSVSWKSIIVLVGALVYFVTPIDLIPDFIPITGFVDDFSVVLWVFNQLKGEIDAFIAWESPKDAATA